MPISLFGSADFVEQTLLLGGNWVCFEAGGVGQ